MGKSGGLEALHLINVAGGTIVGATPDGRYAAQLWLMAQPLLPRTRHTWTYGNAQERREDRSVLVCANAAEREASSLVFGKPGGPEKNWGASSRLRCHGRQMINSMSSEMLSCSKPRVS